MTTNEWFYLLTTLALSFAALLLIDGAHRSRIAELKHIHREQVASLRSYIRTLSRERLWLEQELQRLKDKLAEREQANSHVEHIQWMPLELPPSEEWNEEN